MQLQGCRERLESPSCPLLWLFLLGHRGQYCGGELRLCGGVLYVILPMWVLQTRAQNLLSHECRTGHKPRGTALALQVGRWVRGLNAALACSPQSSLRAKAASAWPSLTLAMNNVWSCLACSPCVDCRRPGETRSSQGFPGHCPAA